MSRLYANLKNDISEQIDLANENPVKLNELIEKYKVYAEKNGVVLPDVAVAYAKPPKLKSF